jgi:hypothetical protein
MDRIDQKYTLITKRSGDVRRQRQEDDGDARFKWGQFRADVQKASLSFSQGFLPALARAGSKLDAFLIGHMDDIRRMGVEARRRIDKIDWKGVEDGANSFIGVLKTGVDLVSKIPPQIDLAIVGFLALNKLSGGLVGKGLENIAGGLGKAPGTAPGPTSTATPRRRPPSHSTTRPRATPRTRSRARSSSSGPTSGPIGRPASRP